MIRQAFTVLLLLASSSLAARWDVGIDAIYWNPYGSGFFIAEIATRFSDSPAQINELVFLRPDFAWGLQAHGEYNSRCLPIFLGAEYSTFEAHGRFGFTIGTNQLASGPGLELSQIGDQAIGTAHVRYHGVDLIGGRCVRLCRGLQLVLDAGAHCLYLHTHASTGTFRQDLLGMNKVKTHFWGAGPLVRTQFKSQLCQCLWAKARMLGGACVGSRDFKRTIIFTNPNTGEIEQDTRTSESATALIPVLGAELELSAAYRTCGICIGAEIGYRTRSYLNLHDSQLFSDRLQSVSIAGPYFGLTTVF